MSVKITMVSTIKFLVIEVLTGKIILEGFSQNQVEKKILAMGAIIQK